MYNLNTALQFFFLSNRGAEGDPLQDPRYIKIKREYKLLEDIN